MKNAVFQKFFTAGFIALLFIFLVLFIKRPSLPGERPSLRQGVADITIDIPQVTNVLAELKAFFNQTADKVWYSLDGGSNTTICRNCSSVQINLNNESPQSIQGLAGWWRFDSVNATNSTPDSSGNGNEGNLKDGNSTNSDGKTLPQLVDGKFGSALSFDGVDDYVDVGNKSSLNFLNSTHAITIEVWIYPTNYTGHNSDQWYFVSKLAYPNKGWWFYLNNGGKVKFTTCDGTCHAALSSESLPLNQWSYVVGWSDGATNKVFVNGVEKASVSSGTLVDADTVNLKIDTSSTGYSFQGLLDEVRLYSRALSADEIKSNYFLKTGQHSVTVYTQDNAGNIDSKSATFTVDDGAPQITFDSPVNQAVYSSDIPIDITFNEPVTGVYGIFNGVKIKPAQDSSNPLKYHVLRKNQLGNITASVYACDLTGNCGITPFWIYASPDAWMHSTYDDFASGTLTNMDAQKEGHITLKRKNLLDNPSFEIDDDEGKSGWFDRDGLADGWGFWGTGYGTYSQESRPSLDLDSTSGKYSQKIDFAPSSDAVFYLLRSQTSGIKELQDYTFSADVKIDSPSNLDISLKLDFYKKTGSSAAPVYALLKSEQSAWASPTTFTRLSVTGRSPSGTNMVKTHIVLRPKFAGASGALRVDSAQLEEGNVATQFSYGYENLTGEFISPAIDMGSITTPYKMEWTSSVPYGDINFKVRAADTLSNLKSAQWYGPSGAGDSYKCISAGVNLLSNPSLETDSDNDGVPDYAEKSSWGTSTAIFSYVNDAYDGSKAVKVEYTSYTAGSGARWGIFYDGALEKGGQYLFNLRHKENKDIGYVSLYASATYSDGTSETLFSDYISTSPNWKQDKVLFRTPTEKNITKLSLYIELSKSSGYIISDSYSLQKADYLCENKINSVHANTRYMQYKTTLSTTDPQFSPSLHDVTVRYGKSMPEIKWINVLDSAGLQKYAFYPGEAATIKPQIVDYKGAGSIKSVRMNVYDENGNAVASNIQLSADASVSDIEQYFRYDYVLPSGAKGIWTITVFAEDAEGKTAQENITIRMKDGAGFALSQTMPISVINNYGFGAAYKNISWEIGILSGHEGAEIWKTSATWNLLESERENLNYEVTDALLALMDGAQSRGVKVQIGINQQDFPVWVDNGKGDSKARYDYDKTKRLLELWTRIAEVVKDHPAFDSYLVIAEENNVYDSDAYLRSIEKVFSAIRSVDPNHRITIRPNTRNSYARTRIAQGGTQNVDYGTGHYPTSASWFNPSYESPVSETSFLGLSTSRESPLAYGWRGSTGELGYGNRKGVDNFGDDEKLIGFERGLKIAYDQGRDEFMMWGGSFDWMDLTYHSKLQEFRDAVVKQPRKTEFDVRVLIDNNNPLYNSAGVPWTGHYKLDMSKEPYYSLIKYLDENGYSWFYTHENAASLQSVNFKRTIRLSQAKWASEEDIKYIIDHNGVKQYGGPAMQFGATNDYVKVNDSPSLRLSTVAMEYWLKPGTWAGSNYHGTHIRRLGTGLGRPYWTYGARAGEQLVFEMRGDDGVGHLLNTKRKEWDSSSFYHIVAQYDNANGLWQIYVNGILDNSKIEKITPSTSAGYLGVGGYSGAGKFDGSIANVRIYNRALTAEEVKEAYYNNVYPADGNVLYLPLDEAGNDAKDHSNSGNNGTIYNATRTSIPQPVQIAPLIPSGSKFMWIGNTDYKHSMTGLDNPYDVSFPDGCSQCDAFALTPSKIRLYADKNARVKIKSPGNAIVSASLNGSSLSLINPDANGYVSFTTSPSSKTNDIVFTLTPQSSTPSSPTPVSSPEPTPASPSGGGGGSVIPAPSTSPSPSPTPSASPVTSPAPSPGPSPVSPSPQTMTMEQLRAEIVRLISLISQLRAQLAQQTSSSSQAPSGFTFQKDLYLGMRDPDVVRLKGVLSDQGCISNFENTDYFGSKTLLGVKCFCLKYKENIARLSGSTPYCSGAVRTGIRAKLNELILR